MKLSKLFFGVAAAAMFAACSSDELVQEQGQPQWDADGNGYMAFSVAMPQDAPGVRANDKFADGLPEEFRVKDVILALFKGTDEASATCVSAYKVDQTAFDMVGTADDNVTSDRLIVQKIVNPGVTGSEKVFAFVVLNSNDIFDVNASDQLTVKGSAFTGNIAALQGAANKVDGLNNSASAFHAADKGFLMMNAPLFNKIGGATDPTGGKIQVLAPVDVNAIKDTKVEASKNTAAHVYVERAVAKVTMTQTGSGSTHTVTAPGMKDFKWTANSWKLDNTNKHSYLVRNTDGFADWTGLKSFATDAAADNYRFVGAKDMKHTGSSVGDKDNPGALYRTYFAKDPNFAPGTLADYTVEYNRDATTTGLSAKFGEDYPQYCAENTFDVANQIWDHTTRVIVETTLTSTGTYFGRPGDDGFLSEDAVKVLAYNKALAAYDSEYATLSATEKGRISGYISYDAALVSVSGNTVTVKFDGTLATSSTTPTDKDYKLVDKFKNTGVAITDLGEGVQYYTGGISYYQSRIKHFGDDLTPWNGEKSTSKQEWYTQPKEGDAAKIYPDEGASSTEHRQDANYLGRWGMLRNNWYALNVKSINKLGYPTPGELVYGTTTDDELESWIAVDVNILSWAKRAQDIDF